jgi:hypothetical protein
MAFRKYVVLSADKIPVCISLAVTNRIEEFILI